MFHDKEFFAIRQRQRNSNASVEPAIAIAAQRPIDVQTALYARHPSALGPAAPRPPAYRAAPPRPAPWYRNDRLGLAVPDRLAIAISQTSSTGLPGHAEAVGNMPSVSVSIALRETPPVPPPPPRIQPERRSAPAPAPTEQPTVTERLETVALERAEEAGQPPEQTRISAALARAAWQPPQPPPQERRIGLLRRRSKPAETTPPFWDAEPVDEPTPPPGVATEHRRRGLAVVTVCGVIAIAGAALGLAVSRLQSPTETTAVFNAPMMVLRAAQTGRVNTVAVKPGQAVDPSTLLLTLQATPKPDPAAASVRARVDVAQRRVSALDEALSQPLPPGDAGRARAVDLRRQRDAAAAELSAAQEAQAHAGQPAPTPELPVLAGVHGVIWSIEAEPGAQAPIGAPLVRLIDCDHPFFTVGSDAGLRAGQSVQVQLPNLPLLPATVRPASGVAEPPDSLVVEPAPGAFARDCPLGASGTMSAVKATSSKRG